MNFFPFQPRDQLLDNLRKKDRYRILGLIGKGRNADIFSCFDTYLNRIVAMKLLRKECCQDEQKVNAFLNETKMISYLDHPGVVSLYDVFVNEEGLPGYTMKLIKGNNIRWDLQSRSRSQILGIFTKLCETLAYVHDKGVAHLDMNPENIMIGQYGEVMITDWGSAKLYDDQPYKEYLKLVRDAPPPPTEEIPEDITRISYYMAPEQLTSNKDAISPCVDIFSMGVILYELMTGTVPFPARDIKTLVQQVRDMQPQLMHEVSPDNPRMLSLICAKMLEKDLFNRYHSFHETLHDLDRFQTSGQSFSSRAYNEGDIIFNEGELGEFAFIVLAGRVEIYRIVNNSHRTLAIIGKGEIAGEVAVFTNEPRTASVRALDPKTTIRIMDRGSVEQEMQKLSPWVQNMITALSRRFMKLNNQLVSK